MSLAGVYDWPTRQGDSSVHRLLIQERDEDGVLQPTDLTNLVFQMQIRTKTSSPIVVLEASTALGNINVVGDPADGLIDVEFTNVELAATRARKYIYDMQATDSVSSASVTLLEGSFIVSPEVTR